MHRQLSSQSSPLTPMTANEISPTTNPQTVTVATSQTRRFDGKWEKLCSNCEEWIGLGPKGSEHSFLAHQRSKRCQRMMERKARQEAKAALESLVPHLSTIPSPPPSLSSHILTAHPSLPSGPLRESGNWEDLPLDPSSPLLLGPSTLPSSLMVCNPSDTFFSTHPPPSPVQFPHLLVPQSSNWISITDSSAPLSTSPTSSHLLPVASTSHVPQASSEAAVCLPCNGIKFEWEHGSFFLSYPLQYHETGYPDWSLDGVGERNGSHVVHVRAHACALFRDPSMDACLPCTNIVSSQGFQNVLKNSSKDPSPNTPYIHLNWNQIQTKLRSTNKELQLERKQV